MSLARIEIEEHRPGFWVAEVEAGYPACRRERLAAGTLLDIVTKIGDAYERMMGRPAVAVAAKPATAEWLPQSGLVPAVAAPAVVEGRMWVGSPEPQTVQWSEPSNPDEWLSGPVQPVSTPVAAKSGWKVPRAPADLVAQARAIGIPAKGTWTRARVLREVAKVAEGKA